MYWLGLASQLKTFPDVAIKQGQFAMNGRTSSMTETLLNAHSLETLELELDVLEPELLAAIPESPPLISSHCVCYPPTSVSSIY